MYLLQEIDSTPPEELAPTVILAHSLLAFYDRRMDGIGQAIIFSSCGFFFPRLFSAVADWIPTILPRMMWP